MRVDVTVELTRDNANSSSGQITFSDVGAAIVITLNDPDRTVTINKEDFERVARILANEL